MKKLLCVLCIFYGIQMNTFSQSVYTLDLKKDIIIGTLSLGIGISPFFINNEPENIPRGLNKHKINSFDRSVMFSYNKPLDIVSDYGVYTLLLLPAFSIMPDIKNINTLLTYGIMYSEAFLLTLGTKDTLKNAIIRYRPYMYADGVPAGKEKDYYNSFPSGSTAYAFLGATFLTTTFSQEFPESTWKLPVIMGSYTLATGIGAMRILSGSHFLTDVFVGAAIGSLYGWLIPWLHLKNDNEHIKIIPTGNGMLVSLRF
ncbi:MAG: phosphatase PAP2 family protein [Treponema sp.]|jgi:membrane-associated phospholipid phosphatase|nr:phosphatase PAP2 family protein [Treponema sp.]